MVLSNLELVCCISSVLFLVTILIALFIIGVVRRTKPRLHTCRHFLMCNSSVAWIVSCTILIMNYIHLFFLPSQTSDISCRYRGYLAYMSITAVTYSYLIQSISRLFFSLLSTKHATLVTFKTHSILIGLNWLTAVVIPLSTIITSDIRFISGSLCWIRPEAYLHGFMIVIIEYAIPLGLVMVIYAYIYCEVKKRRRNARSNTIVSSKGRLELELLRNIAVLVGIFLLGGVWTFIYVITSIKLFDLIGIVMVSLCASAVQICTIALDRDFRQVVQSMFRTNTRVNPLATTQQVRTIETKGICTPNKTPS